MAQSDYLSLENKITGEISSEELWKHTSFIAAEDRVSGSRGEAKSVRYFKEFMENLGFQTSVQEIENFISVPVSAEVRVIHPEFRQIPCITQSFSAETPPEGIEGNLIYRSGGRGHNLTGSIVMEDGLASPLSTWEIEKRGAAGQVWVNAGELPRNMCITTIWGHPTPETVENLPKTPIVSLDHKNGEVLKALCEKGPVKLRLKTKVDTRFIKVPLAIADVQGHLEPEKYVLFNGHIDSWHKGASDNAGANACMLEVARLLSKYREYLRRGVRFAWWSGHSQGRYSGSTWYADYNREDLYENAIIHLNIDSIGCQGAVSYSEVECTAEAYELGKSLIQKYTGQEAKYQRIGRSGDNSFWGIGIPTLFQLLSRQPPGKGGQDVLVPGLPWFWHTEEDTLDKMDREIFLRDTQIYMAAVWRLCTLPLLPFTFQPAAEEMTSHLSQYQEEIGDRFSFSGALEKARLFTSRTREMDVVFSRINQAFESMDSSKAMKYAQEGVFAAINRLIMKVSRLLIPVSYSAVDHFDMDRAFPISPFSRLSPVRLLGTLDPESWDFKFLERKLVREQNRIIHALALANEILEEIDLKLKGIMK